MGKPSGICVYDLLLRQLPLCRHGRCRNIAVQIDSRGPLKLKGKSFRTRILDRDGTCLLDLRDRILNRGMLVAVDLELRNSST